MKFKFQILFICSLLIVANVYADSNEGDISIPFRYAKGQVLFEKYCSSCHANNLKGTDQGPPLLHPFYKPSHHGDDAFFRAGLKGVKAHHWKFGDMPAVAGMTDRKMKSITQYIRFYQKQKKLF